MTFKLISYAAVILAVLGAIWYFVIIPAEKRDHQRRMDLVQRKLEQHKARKNDEDSDLHS